MFFCGINFATDTNKYYSSASPISRTSVDYVEIKNVEVDDVLIENEIIPEDRDSIGNMKSYQWSGITQFHAAFEGSLEGGNVQFQMDNIKKMLLIRERSHDREVLYEKDINNFEDLKISFKDYTARNNTDYKYYLIPINKNNIQGTSDPLSIRTHFRGTYIISPRYAFAAHLEVDIVPHRNRPVSVLEAPNKRYPYVVSLGNVNYTSGSFSASLARFLPDDCDFTLEDVWKYRDFLFDELNSSRAILLKAEDGQMWLCKASSPQLSTSHEMYFSSNETISFEWTEIADCEDAEKLKIYGFLDEGDIRDVDEVMTIALSR